MNPTPPPAEPFQIDALFSDLHAIAYGAERHAGDRTIFAVKQRIVAALEVKDRESERLKRDVEFQWEGGRKQLATIGSLQEQIEQAEQREAEARRLLECWLPKTPYTQDRLEIQGHCVWCGKLDDQPHAPDCQWVAAKNFLESKPLEATVEGED